MRQLRNIKENTRQKDARLGWEQRENDSSLQNKTPIEGCSVWTALTTPSHLCTWRPTGLKKTGIARSVFFLNTFELISFETSPHTLPGYARPRQRKHSGLLSLWVGIQKSFLLIIISDKYSPKFLLLSLNLFFHFGRQRTHSYTKLTVFVTRQQETSAVRRLHSFPKV